MRFYRRPFRGRLVTTDKLPTWVLERDLNRARPLALNPDYAKRVREQIEIELLARKLEGRL